MQAYKKIIDRQSCCFLSQRIVFYAYKNKCEIFCNTATLLIHTLKYLSSVSSCFTKEKIGGRV